MVEPLQGSCLCGGVRFEITESFLNANHCHCSRCRKHSGTFGETQGRVPREGFRLISGEELIRVYRPADDAGVKAFCSPGRRPRLPACNPRFPLLSNAFTHRHTVFGDTPNTADTAAWVIPPLTAATARRRRSSCACGESRRASRTVTPIH